MSATVTPTIERTSQDAPAVWLRIAGSLGRDAVHDFDEAVSEVRSVGADRLVVLDLARVDVCDHDGLRALDGALGLRADAPGNVVVRGVSAAAREVLRVDRQLEELRALRPCA